MGTDTNEISGMERALLEQEGCIDTLGSTVKVLMIRLNPVLKPEAKEPSTDSPNSLIQTRSPVVTTITKGNQQMREITRMVENLISRIEL